MDILDGLLIAINRNKNILYFKDLKKFKKAAGCNQGGFYKHKKTGIEYYVKLYESSGPAFNEKRSSNIMRMLGLRVPDTVLVDMNGRGHYGYASKLVDFIAVKKKTGGFTALKNSGVIKGFLMDVLLSSYDCIGPTCDNMGFERLSNDNWRVIRIDLGATGRYRASGLTREFKGNTVCDELNKFLQVPNPYTHYDPENNLAMLFRPLSKIVQEDIEIIEQISWALEKLKKVTDQNLKDACNLNIPLQYQDQYTSQSTYRVLKKRKKALLSFFESKYKQGSPSLSSDAGSIESKKNNRSSQTVAKISIV